MQDSNRLLRRCVFACALLAALFLPNAPTTAAITRYYRFETNNGSAVSDGQTITSADDSSGNNLNGTVTGTPQYATTPFISPLPGTGATNQFCYVGSSGARVSLSGVAVPILAPTFTVEAYFRMNSIDPNTGDVKSLFRVEDPSTGTGIFSLELLNLHGGNGTNDLLVVMSNDTLELSRDDLLINTNYHVAATYDGAIARLYLDGTLVDSANFTGFSGSGLIGGAIGNDTTISGGITTFRGNIDELRISDVALAPSQFLDAVPEPTGFSGLGLVIVIGLRRRSHGHSVTAT